MNDVPMEEYGSSVHRDQYPTTTTVEVTVDMRVIYFCTEIANHDRFGGFNGMGIFGLWGSLLDEYWQERDGGMKRIFIGSMTEIGLGVASVLVGIITLTVVTGPESPALINAAAPIWVGTVELIPGILGCCVLRYGNPDRRIVESMNSQKSYIVAHYAMSTGTCALAVIMIVFAVLSITMCKEDECTLLQNVEIFAAIHIVIASLMIIVGITLTVNICYLFKAFGFEERTRF